MTINKRTHLERGYLPRVREWSVDAFRQVVCLRGRARACVRVQCTQLNPAMGERGACRVVNESLTEQSPWYTSNSEYGRLQRDPTGSDAAREDVADSSGDCRAASADSRGVAQPAYDESAAAAENSPTAVSDGVTVMTTDKLDPAKRFMQNEMSRLWSNMKSLRSKSPVITNAKTASRANTEGADSHDAPESVIAHDTPDVVTVDEDGTDGVLETVGFGDDDNDDVRSHSIPSAGSYRHAPRSSSSSNVDT